MPRECTDQMPLFDATTRIQVSIPFFFGWIFLIIGSQMSLELIKSCVIGQCNEMCSEVLEECATST